MANRRTYSDDQLREAVASSTTWREVLTTIGKKHGSSYQYVQAVADRLGLDTSHLHYKRNFRVVQANQTPFTNKPELQGRSGLSIAAQWFLDRGYIISIPLEPAPYDLISESDEGLKRIQVKTTNQISKSGRRSVSISRLAYEPGRSNNANGPRRKMPYDPTSIDYFFIVTPDQMYLIPVESVKGAMSLVLDEKYSAFAVI